jgi:antitoxin PrlF
MQGKRLRSAGRCPVLSSGRVECLFVGSRLTDKGQITVPRLVRERLGLRPGDEVEFVAEGDGYRLRKVLRRNPFSRYRGHLDALAGRDPDALVRDLRGE